MSDFAPHQKTSNRHGTVGRTEYANADSIC